MADRVSQKVNIADVARHWSLLMNNNWPCNDSILRDSGSAVLVALMLSGCSLVPGTYLGVEPRASETGEAYKYDISGTEDISERAEIYAITPNALAKQRDEEISAKERDASNREKLRSIDAVGASSYKYIIGAQDVLNVTVWNHPEINNPSGVMNAQLAGRTVNADGTFFFPYAGKVRAAGRTVQEVREDLATRLSRVLVEPQVDVSVLSYRSQRTFILGQVEKPGIVPITDVPLTITDLITQAGGLTPEADLTAATLMRQGRALPIDLYALYYEGDIRQNVSLVAGDILTIPENRFKKVFVLGEVSKPQSMVMPRGRMTLAEAISDSGGFNPLTSNAGQLYVIRDGSNGKAQIWHLDAASPDALILADRFTLRPRDVVYVDPAGVARFSRIINNILPTATVLRATVQN